MSLFDDDFMKIRKGSEADDNHPRVPAAGDQHRSAQGEKGDQRLDVGSAIDGEAAGPHSKRVGNCDGDRHEAHEAVFGDRKGDERPHRKDAHEGDRSDDKAGLPPARGLDGRARSRASVTLHVPGPDAGDDDHRRRTGPQGRAPGGQRGDDRRRRRGRPRQQETRNFNKKAVDEIRYRRGLPAWRVFLHGVGMSAEACSRPQS